MFEKIPRSWKIKNGKLCKNFKFKDFKKTLSFVNKVGEIAEKEDHHPEIYFTWGKCRIEIFTHSENAITEKDFALTEKINRIK